MKQSLWEDGFGIFILESVSFNKVIKTSIVHKFILPKHTKNSKNTELLKDNKHCKDTPVLIGKHVKPQEFNYIELSEHSNINSVFSKRVYLN